MRSSIRIKTVTPVSLREFTNVKKNLHILGELLTEKAVRVAGYMMADVLTTAQPQVPLQSDWQGHARSWGGKLRESGEARVMFGKNAPGRNFGGYGLNVAKGRRDGGVNIDLSKLRGRLNKSVKYITGNASYIKIMNVEKILHFGHMRNYTHLVEHLQELDSQEQAQNI